MSGLPRGGGGAPSATLSGHEGAVLAVRFNPKGTYCLTCGRDRTLRLWNPHSGLAVKTYVGHGYEVRDVAVSDDNATLASVGRDRQPFVWDTQRGVVVRKFRGHEGEPSSVCFAGQCQVLYTGGSDKRVMAWDLRSGGSAEIQALGGFRDDVTSVAASGPEVVAASADGTLRSFDCRRGEVATDTLPAPVACVSLSGDAKCALAGCLDSTVRLLDRSDGALLNEYAGHANAAAKVASCLTADDANVLSGGEDGRLVAWDLVDASVAMDFRAHQDVVTGVACHPDGGCVITCSTDATAKVWK